ncbi:unnamed protein product, partial [Rotaria magnacalcarata]
MSSSSSLVNKSISMYPEAIVETPENIFADTVLTLIRFS